MTTPGKAVFLIFLDALICALICAMGPAQAADEGGGGAAANDCVRYDTRRQVSDPEVQQGTGRGCYVDFGEGWAGMPGNRCQRCLAGTLDALSGKCVVETQICVESGQALQCDDYAYEAARQSIYWFARECQNLTLVDNIPADSWNTSEDAHLAWCVHQHQTGQGPAPTDLRAQRIRLLGACDAARGPRTNPDASPKAPFASLASCTSILMLAGGIDNARAQIICHAAMGLPPDQ